MLKYKLTNDVFTTAAGKELYRIEAVRNIYGSGGAMVPKGETGGYIESPANLSQEGNSWVGGNAMVIDKAIVEGNAYVGGNAVVSGTSVITDSAAVSQGVSVNNSLVSGTSIVKDSAFVKNSNLHGHVIAQGKADISDSTLTGDVNVMERGRVFSSTIKGADILISGTCNVELSDLGGDSDMDDPSDLIVTGNAIVQHARIHGKNVFIKDNATVGKGVLILGEKVRLEGDSHVSGKVEILNDVTITELAVVRNTGHLPLHLDDTLINGDVLIEKE